MNSYYGYIISYIIVYENSNCNYNVTIKNSTVISYSCQIHVKALKPKISQFFIFHKTQNWLVLKRPSLISMLLPKTHQQPVPYGVEMHYIPVTYMLVYLIQWRGHANQVWED